MKIGKGLKHRLIYWAEKKIAASGRNHYAAKKAYLALEYNTIK